MLEQVGNTWYIIMYSYPLLKDGIWLRSLMIVLG